MADIASLVLEVAKSLGLVRLVRGYDEELESLKRSVSTFQGMLPHAEELCAEKPQLKEWVKTLKDVIYDAEDLLDEISTDGLRHQLMVGDNKMKRLRGWFSRENPLVYAREMASKIDAVRDELKRIAEDGRLLGDWNPSPSERSIRTQTHPTPPKDVFGREDDKQAIVEKLLSDSVENVSVVAIVGIGGLGKTTLAQYVYSDEGVKKQFELRSWICVSDNFDLELTATGIIKNASPSISERSLMNPLVSLPDAFNGKRFLIVLDDLWSDDQEKWSRLKDLLAGGARGSMIVITTRDEKVAKTARWNGIHVHTLQGLSETESWLLFKQMAFEPGQQPSPSLEAIGKEIVAKCSGSPLAIRTIGNLLFLKDSDQWQSIRDSLKYQSKLEVVQSQKDIWTILKLSYNHLPYHLKLCFAYCSLFPKDYEFDVETLINLWIAQGYVVSPNSNRCLEDIGNEYFEDLLHWGLSFQQHDEFGNISFFKMHDWMHDLAIEVSGEECVMSKIDMTNINASSRHILFEYIQSSELQFSTLLSKESKVRTLLMLKSEGRQMKREQCIEIFSSLRFLRALDLRWLQIEIVPSSIGKLKHLRYLDLSWNKDIKVLPDSITNLLNLQVLNLSGLSLTRLPKDIKNLVNLTQLKIDGCGELTHMPRGIGELTRLTKLSRFVIGEDDSVSAELGELGGLNQLRGSLTIRNLRNVRDAAVECKEAKLKQKERLQQLRLEWSYEHTTADVENNNEMALEAFEPHRFLKALSIDSYMGVKVPSWFSSLTILVQVEFCYCPNIKRLPPLDYLRFLKKLWIRGLTNLEYIEGSGASSSFFPSLENLSFYGCPNLKGWNIDNAESLQFSCLSDLSVYGCPNLTSMPMSPSLKRLDCESKILPSDDSSSSSFLVSLFPLLSQLETLLINANGDSYIISAFRERSISKLPKLASLSKVLEHLTTLRYLTIYENEILNISLLISMDNENEI